MIMEWNAVESALKGLEARLHELETRYGMTSDEFYCRYEAGELEDSADFMEWAAFCDMYTHERSATELS